MSDVFFSKYLANRYPNPEGRRIQIGTLLSGLGASAISTELNAGDLGESVSTHGMWANLDATSITTLGYLADLSLAGIVENTVILTDNAPITKGYGDAQLAEPEDVEVLVNGTEVPILAMDPIVGVIVLDEILDPDSDVQVSYYYTQNPTLEITSLNSTSFRLNQWKARSLMPFTYNTVLGPYNRPQPRQYEYRYRAFDYPYTSVLNDPTSLSLNEPKHQITIPRFKRENHPFSLFFEGDDDPEDFEHVGPPLGPVQIEDDLYIIDDVTSSQTVVDGQPSFFQRALDLSFSHIAVLNWRMRVLEWEKSGIFSGIAAGYSDVSQMYFVGFLEIGDFKTIGILAEENEEEWESYLGLEAEVTGPSELTFGLQPPLPIGTEAFVAGSVYEVVNLEEDNGSWLVTLDDVLPMASGSVQAFPEMDWTVLTTYRLFKNQDDVLQVVVGGSVLPHIQVDAQTTGISPDIFAVLDTNSLFFGSFDQKTTSRSGWDFYRFSMQPVTRLDQDQVVIVNSTFEELPDEDEVYPWYLSDNQGYSAIFDDEYLLTQSAGQHAAGGGGIAYTRVEPFLTSKAIVDLSARLRVQSYATGIPAFFTIADDKKEVTLGLFDDAALFTDDGANLITKGFWSGSDAASLLSQGHISGLSLVPEDQYVALFSGTRPFDDVGWDSDITSFSFFDSYMRITHDGADTQRAIFEDSDVSSFGNHVLNCRFRVRSFTPLMDGRVPMFWGTDDADAQVYLMPFEDPGTGDKYIVFCDEDGTIILDGGNPVGFAFDWDDDQYHAIKATRFGANVTVFIDGVYQTTVATSLLPSSTAIDDEVRTRFALLEEELDVDLDYLFAHSAPVTQRRVGVHRGGSLLDTTNYDFVPVEWLGTFMEVRVRRDPTSRTSIFVNDPDTPVLEYQYSELPNRGDAGPRFNTNTELGYVQFGTVDPNALSEVLWDYMRYKVINRRLNQKANNNAILNRHNVMSSPEPIIDEDPETVLIEADGTHFIHLAKVGMYARTVLGVFSEDGMTTYPFTYDFDSNTIVLTGAGLPTGDETVKVVFYHRSPFTESYLENNWAFTRLNVDTPPVPLRQQVDLQAVPLVGPAGDAEALMTKGFWGNSDPSSLVTQGNVNLQEEGTATDGPLTIRFEKNSQAFYECLKMLEWHDEGAPDVIAPACDENGLKVLDFEGPFGEDHYQIPPQCDENGTEHRYKIGFFNNTNSVFNDIQTNTAYPKRCFTMELAQTFEEEVAAAEDEIVPAHPNSYMEDFYGFRHIFNSMFYTLNGSSPTGDPVHPDSKVATTNRYCEYGCVIDLFDDDPLVPIDPSDPSFCDPDGTCPLAP